MSAMPTFAVFTAHLRACRCRGWHGYRLKLVDVGAGMVTAYFSKLDFSKKRVRGYKKGVRGYKNQF
jgi:hypothetical protein